MSVDLHEAARRLIDLEGALLDRRQWDRWLTLYEEDAVFWVPAWRSDEEPTTDPARETSMIYLESRGALEDRAWRLGTGRSLASAPLLRTSHVSGSVMVEEGVGGEVKAFSSWACHVFNVRNAQQHVFFGTADYELVRRDAGRGGLGIRRKTATLLNDRVPSLLDFYCV